MRAIYNLFLTFNATVFIIIVFLISHGYKIFSKLPYFVSFSTYILVVILITRISIFLTKFLSKDSIEGGINDITIETENFLPTYLGYFFVGLEVENFSTLMFVFLILFTFTFFSQTVYFNPMFLIFRYKFYHLTMENNSKILIISKRMLKDKNNVHFNNLRRINEYTFFDKEK